MSNAVGAGKKIIDMDIVKLIIEEWHHICIE